MKIPPFATEHFFARYEFSTPYQLCNSDCETLSIEELLKIARVPIEEFGNLSLGYTETLGNPTLREIIASTYEKIKPEDVIMLGTPIEGIYLTARTALNPGDEVVVLCPAYDALINLFEHVVGAGNVRKWRFKPGLTRWELDFDELDQLISAKTKMLVVNFPHNPTGYLPSQELLNKLAELADQRGLILFCDEMYFGLVHSGTPPITSAADLTQSAVVLSGLSKTYGLPGLRSGWLIVQDKALRAELVNWKFYTSICPPAPTEFLTAASLKVREQLRERSLAQIERNLKLADDFFLRWPELFTWRHPQAGSTALVEMLVPSVEVFAGKMAREAGILILPATNMGWDDQHFRLGLGRSTFKVALEQFEKYLISQ